MKQVVIRSEPMPDEAGNLRRFYWSNREGWAGFAEATRFSADEARLYRLPVGGDCWVPAEGIVAALNRWEDHLRISHPWWYLGFEAVTLILMVAAAYGGLLLAGAFDVGGR